MNLDRELREALQPLAGDPVADAMRVLAALPPVPPPAPAPPRRIPPWWLLGGIVLGLTAGLGLGFALSPGPPDPAQQAENEKILQEQKAKEAAAKGKAPPGMPSDSRQWLDVTAFGAIAIDEPGEGKQELKPGQYMTKLGTTFTSNDALVGVYVFVNDARVRLDRRTVAEVQPDLVVLRSGRLWLSNLDRPAEVTLRTDYGEVRAPAAVLQLEVLEHGVRVSCLDGLAQVVSPAGQLRLQGGRQVEFGRGGPGEIGALPFAGTITNWMTPMVLMQRDDSELRARVGQMLQAYLEGTHRDPAEAELRRLGGHCVPRLFEAIEAMAASALRERTARLLAEVADYGHAVWLVALLERGDAATRAIAFTGLVRITGAGVEDETFWRDAGDAEREAAAARWRERLR